MKLKEYIDVITSEMISHKWQEREVRFATIDSFDLEYLSIYEDETDEDEANIVTEEDNQKRNNQAN